MSVALPVHDTGIGIDGCRGGWVWCRRSADGWDGGIATRLADLRWLMEAGALTLVDMPIGLVTDGCDERRCDRAARALLGRPRASSVFRPPCRAALAAADYATACDVNRRHTGVALSQQTWNIAAKIREVDLLLTADPSLCDRLLEAHPEVCLWGLAGGRPMHHNKRTPRGRRERLALLGAVDPGAAAQVEAMARSHPRRAVAPDDIADAAVLAVTAATAAAAEHLLRLLPEEPERDRLGLPMQMLYVRR
jgi:predicted RNase H-like nuclease